MDSTFALVLSLKMLKGLKLTWKLLNDVINKETSKPSLPSSGPSSFKGEGKSIIDPKVIADRFFTYFLLVLAQALQVLDTSSYF